MRTIFLASLLVFSVLSSVLQIARLRKFRSGRATIESSTKAFSLMKRSFVAVWVAGASVSGLIFEWSGLTLALCLLGGILLAHGIQLLTQASGLMAFVEAGEDAMAARRAVIKQACSSGNLFLVRSNGKEHLPKIVPARPEWDALLHFRGDRVHSSAS